MNKKQILKKLEEIEETNDMNNFLSDVSLYATGVALGLLNCFVLKKLWDINSNTIDKVASKMASVSFQHTIH